MLPAAAAAGATKKEAPPAVHVPIEPTGMNAHGTMHFSQGLLPSSCWLVVPASALSHPQVPVPQIQVMNSTDYTKIIEIACADLAMTTKLKSQHREESLADPARAREYMLRMKEQFDRGHISEALKMITQNAPGSPSQSMSPSSMSPKASIDR